MKEIFKLHIQKERQIDKRLASVECSCGWKSTVVDNLHELQEEINGHVSEHAFRFWKREITKENKE